MNVQRTLAVGDLAEEGGRGWFGQCKGCQCRHEQTNQSEPLDSIHELSNYQGNTITFMCIPSWYSLQITVQTAS